MKKRIQLLFLAIVTSAGIYAQSLWVSPTQCYAGTNVIYSYLTGTVSGSTSYSWAISAPNTSCVITPSMGSTVANFVVGCPGVYTIVVTPYNGSTPLTAFTSTSSILPSFSISVTGNNVLCFPGDTATLTASGATNYTWYPGGMTGSQIFVTPTVATNYTVFGGQSGCGNAASIFVTIQPSSITINGGSQQCNGVSLQASPSGLNYTWTPSNTTGSGFNSGFLNPGVYCYTVNSSSSCGNLSATKCVTVGTQPTVSISGNNTVCAGQSMTLTATGANTYSWMGLGSTSPSVVITPTTSFTGSLIASSGPGCSVTLPVFVNVTSIAVTSSPATFLCPGQSATLTAGAAQSYSWFAPGNISLGTSNTVVVTPSVNTCYTVYAVVNGCSVSKVYCMSVGTPSINVSTFGGPICQPGQSITLVANGVNSATWQPGNLTGSVVVVTPSVNTCYTVTGTSFPFNGCQGQAVKCVNFGNYTQIASSVNVCPGGYALVATGAVNTTWSVQGPSSQNNSSGTMFYLLPSASGVYTVTATTPSCTSSFTVNATMIPAPTVMISGNSSFCFGSVITLTASGASSYIWYSTFSSGTQTTNIYSAPASSGTVYLFGTAANGCTATAAQQVSLLPFPPITVSPSITTVCKGTSANLTASGANTYTWSTGAFGASTNVLPNVTASYTVLGTGSNGCIGGAGAVVVVDTTCSDVWPGDANSDGVVTSQDVIEVGLHNNATGPARANISILWNSNFCNNWSGTVSTGKNKCHADCNGNGTVNSGDVGAVYANLNNTHAFRSAASADPVITLVAPKGQVIAGEYVKADIILANESTPVSNVFGITFDVLFDNTFIEQDAAYIVYTNSFLNENGNNIEFQKPFFNNGKIVAVSSRTDGQNVNGYGKIAEFWFKPKADVPDGTVINLNLTTTSVTDNKGKIETISAGSEPAIVNDRVGINEGSLNDDTRLYPNPSKGLVTIQIDVTGSVNYVITDVIGRTVATGDFTNKTTVDVGAFGKGVYLVKLSNGKANGFRKIVIE